MTKSEPDHVYAKVPMRTVGPIKVESQETTGELDVPLATFETPLWPSVNRGAAVTRKARGISAVVVDDRMSRSVLLEASSAQSGYQRLLDIKNRYTELARKVTETSRFAKLKEIHTQLVGTLIYLRFEMQTGDAAGHNMVTAAADALLAWIMEAYPDLQYVSVSGNYCTDKKASAVNGILGRGKYVIAEMTIPDRVCRKILKTTPKKIVDLHIKKNLIGTSLAGGIRTANAHFANMLLGFYLATGQDAANIVEGSQGYVHAELKEEDLYFSTTLPNIIVGTVGNGKNLPFVRENLEQLGCTQESSPGMNARKLAVIAAATVWCGELSLLAAQTNPGELMRAHLGLERS